MATAQEWWMGPNSLWGQGQSALANIGRGIGDEVNRQVNWWTGPNSLMGMGNRVGQGWLDRFVADASGQGIPEGLSDPQKQEIKDAIRFANLTPEQAQEVWGQIESGSIINPEDARAQIEHFRTNNEKGQFIDRSVTQLGELTGDLRGRYAGDQTAANERFAQQEAEYLGPNSLLTQTFNRLNTIHGDPMAISRDIDYAPIFANVLNQTAAESNRANREGAQRAAGRGVSGSGGANLMGLTAAQTAGSNQRNMAFGNAVTDVNRRLSGLDETRRVARSELDRSRNLSDNYYTGALSELGKWGQAYGDDLRSGGIRSPFDYASQGENRIGTNMFNQGLTREQMDRIAGLGVNALGLGINGLGQMQNIPIPGLNK